MSLKSKRWLAIVLWVALNSLVLWSASTLGTVVVDSWKKGPLIDPAAPYAPENAQLYFAWIALWILNTYVLGLLFTFRFQKWRYVAPVLVFVISLLTAEFGMQAYLQHNQTTHFRPHPTLHWMCRPHLQNFVSSSDGIVLNTNQHGMREVPTTYAKDPDEFRILVLGDSSNFGQGVSGQEMWSAQLQEILSQSTNQKITVYNAACPGWTTYQGLEVMNAYGWDFQPDLVIAGFNNDAGPDFMTDRQRVSPLLWVRSIQSVLYRSEVFVIAREAILAWIRRWSPQAQKAYRTRLAGEKSRYGKLDTKEQLALVSRVPLDEMEANLQTLQQQARDHNAQFMWVNMPINRKEFDLVDRYVDWYYRERIDNFTTTIAIPYVGVDEYWQRTREPDLHILGHVFHPNATGHRRMAEQIAKEIAALHWIEGVVESEIALQGPPPATGIDTLRLGWSSKTPIHAHLGVALQRYPELVEQFGLEIEWVSYDSGKVQGKDLAEGKLDAWFSCAVPAIHMLDTRPDSKVVASLGELGEIALLVHNKDAVLNEVALTKGSTPHQVWTEREMSKTIRLKDQRTDSLWESFQRKSVDGIVIWDPWVREWMQDTDTTIQWSQPFYSVLIVGEMWALGDLKDPRVPRLVALLEAVIAKIEANPELIDQAVAELGGWSLDTVRTIREENTVFQQQSSLELSPKVIRELQRSHRFAHPQSGGFYALAPEWIHGLPRKP